jgi:hypothetical protein
VFHLVICHLVILSHFGCGKVALHASLLGGRVGAAKRSAVSTGRLKRLPALYVRPIDLVVFQEPVQHTLPETCSCGGFHA